MWQLAINIPEKGFIKTSNNIKWPQMVEEILLKAFFLVKNLRTHTVLIQCQNGKDASSVLSSLAQIISDPYYRTFKGFQTLIYKEWIFMHHNFIKKSSLMLLGVGGEEINSQVLSSDIRMSQNKMKLLPNINNSKDYCPYFIFFLDCVNQLIKMNES